MTKKKLIETMRNLAKEGTADSQGSYNKLWEAVTVLWNLGLVDYQTYNAMIREDRRAWEAGEMTAWAAPAFDLETLDI